VRDLNNDILKQMEKAISDLLIPNLFVECGGASPGISQSRIRPDILHIEITGTAYGTSAEAEQKKRGANEGISVDGAVPGISEEGRKAAQQRALPFFQGSSGTSRTQNLGGSAQRKSHGMHRRSLLHGNKNGRFLQGGNLVGLRVTPPDVVLLGAFQSTYSIDLIVLRSQHLPDFFLHRSYHYCFSFFKTPAHPLKAEMVPMANHWSVMSL